MQGNHTIAIFGQGPVGLSATQLAAQMGARVIALDTSPDRLVRARQFGAEHVIDPGKTENVVQAIRDLTHGLGAHVSLEASSSPAARAQAVRCVRTWGKACFVGEGDSVTLDHAPRPESASDLRSKVYGHVLDRSQYVRLLRDAITGRLSDIELAAFIAAAWRAGRRRTLTNIFQ